MQEFIAFLKDPFGSGSNAPLSAWRLFLVIGLIIMLLVLWGFLFRQISADV